MDWDVEFGRKVESTWIVPGYHHDLKKTVGQTISIKDGRRVRLTNIEFNLPWNKLSLKEKKLIKRRFGNDAKRSYHFYTRVTLERVIAKQLYFPFDCVTD